jgi:hypothetical protein
MYEQQITRRRPGCIVFLLDRSDSMKRSWGGGSETLAQGAAGAVNAILDELCTRATKGEDKVYDYFDVGVFGYGRRPAAGGEGVESAFTGALAGQPLVPISQIAENYVGMRKVESIDLGGVAEQAYWIEAVYGYRTPMCQAIAEAGAHVFEWAQEHPDSFPPIVINITDGIVTDDPYSGLSLRDWAERLTRIATQDGSALLFNVFVAPEASGEVVFPASGAGLPAPGPALFQISSLLPDPMRRSASIAGLRATDGSRGFAFNVSDSKSLAKILEIGTRTETRLA